MAVHKEQLNIESGADLEDFVKASGGVNQAAALILSMSSNNNFYFDSSSL